MLNLLPPQYKEELRQEENFRLVLVLGILIFAFFLCFSLLLVSLRIYLAGEIKAQRVLLESQKTSSRGDAVLQRNIQELNRNMSSLSSFYKDQAMVSKILQHISDALPQGVYLTSLTFSPSGESLKISLSGFAPTVDDLLKLKRSIEQDPMFLNMNFPPANWVSPDISFSLNVDVDQTQARENLSL